jgi:hypothetical protein
MIWWRYCRVVSPLWLTYFKLISAYRKTGLKKIIYAAAAFGLFAIQLLIESLEETFEVLDTGYGSVITSSLTLAILVLFFLAIVQKNK